MKSRFGLLSSCACLWLLIAGSRHPARAELLSYEPADYPGTSSIEGASGGLGWATAWSGLANATAQGLDFPGLATSGLRLTTDGNNTASSRTFATAAHPSLLTNDGRFGRDGTTLWFSFLVQRHSSTATGTYAGVSLWNDSTRQGFFGVLRDRVFWGASIDALGTAGNFNSTLQVVNNTTVFVVLKLSFGVSGVNDRIDMFLNPAPGTEPVAGAVTATGFNFRFNRLLINSGDTATVAGFDEFRLGTTYADVAPARQATPPPPDVVWARAAGGDWPFSVPFSQGPVSAVLSGPDDGVILGGTFSTQALLGSQVLAGDENGYVVRLESNGSTAAWTQVVSSPDPGFSADGIHDIATDGAGNLYVCGKAGSPPVFGLASLTQRLFVAKLNAAGQPVWGTPLDPKLLDVLGTAVDADGNVFACGYTTSDLVDNRDISYTFGNSTVLGLRGWIAKLDQAGNFLWVRSAGDVVSSLAVDSQGNVAAAGYFVRTKRFGTEELTSSDPTFFDAFAIKLDPAGSVMWRAVSQRANDNEFAQAVAADPAGNTFVAMDFATGGTFAGTAIPTSGTRQMVVAKLDPQGALLWTTATTAPFDGIVSALLTDAAGNVYLGGSLAAPDLGPFSLPSPGVFGPFIAKLSGDGAPSWLFGASDGTGGETVTALGWTSGGDLLFGGNYENPLTLGAFHLPRPSSPRLTAPAQGFAGRLATGAAAATPLVITDVAIVGGKFMITVAGPVGARVKVESSPDLSAWGVVSELTLGQSPSVVEAAPDTAPARRFFRARPQ